MSESVLITGASRGVGRATALLAAQRGCSVLILGRNSNSMQSTLGELNSLGNSAKWFECELSERHTVDRALAELSREPAPDLMIHNAGIVERSVVTDLLDAAWDRQFEVNVTAPMRITRALLPPMLERGRGRIVFVSSISAVLGSKGQSAYNASKAALVGLMRCLAEELSNTELATMALLPGAVDTDMLRGSGFEPRMSAEDVAKSLLYYGLDAPRGHNGAVIEMFGV